MTMKKMNYPKGQPSGARGKPETKKPMTAKKKDKEMSVKGQPRGNAKKPNGKGNLAKPFKRSDR